MQLPSAFIPPTMRVEHLAAALLAFAFASCSHDQRVQETTTALRTKVPAQVHLLAPIAHRDLLDFGILQKTCALYVAVRSSAWKGPLAFGREVDDSMVQWNFCPGGKKVACKVSTTASGDTVITGIDWPHGEVAVLEGAEAVVSH
jgi:hypothetical protein